MNGPDLTAADLLVLQAMLAAGAGPHDALMEVSCPALAPVRGALRAGVALPAIAADLRPGRGPHRLAALWRRTREDDVPGLPPAAAALLRALAVAQVVGAPAGPAVQRVLDAVRGSLRLQGLIRIRSAQAVLSARFLVGLPVMAGAALVLVHPAARLFLTSPLGVATAAVAGVLVVLAAVWIRVLTGGIAGAGSQADPLVTDDGGRDPVPATAIAIGLLATVVAGLPIGLLAGVALRLTGPALRRRLRGVAGDASAAAPDAPHRTPRVTPSVAGGLPTVEAIELVSLALSAGVGLTEACHLAARLGPPEVRPALADVARRLGNGMQPGEAFPAQLAELAHLIDLTHRWGAPTAEALGLLAGDIRGRAATAAEEAAERLTVQLVFPTTVLLVPAFGLLVVVPLVASTLSGVGLGL